MEYRTNQIDNSNDEQVDIEKIDVNISKSSEIKCENSDINEENENNNLGVKDTDNPANVIASPKTRWYRNPTYRKIGLFVLLGVVISSLVIGLAVGLTGCRGSNCKTPPPPSDSNNTTNTTDDDDKFIIYTYKISTLYFNSTKEEIIKTLLEELNVDNKRRLKEQKKTKTINTEYLFTIVSVPNDTLNIDYYTGYVLILNRSETLKGLFTHFFTFFHIFSHF